MNFDWRKLDLRKSCIFDLTDDIEMIRQCTCRRTITLEDREEYLSESDEYDIPQDMRAFAGEINDDELKVALNNIYADIYAKYDIVYDE